MVDNFQTFSTEHLLLLLLAGLLVLCVAHYCRSLSGSNSRKRAATALATLIIVQEFIGQGIRIFLQDWRVDQDLLLHMCGLAIFIVPYALLTQKRWAIELSYYWGIGGSLQALLTPSLSYSLPEYHTVHFFVSHTSLLAGAVAVMILSRYKLTLRGLRTAIVTTFSVAFVALFCNLLINSVWQGGRANYWYTLDKPLGSNITAYLPAWPFYLPIVAAIVVVVFGVMYILGPHRRNRISTEDSAKIKL